MSLAEVGEDGQNYTPNADKECQGEQKNLPLGNPGRRPSFSRTAGKQNSQCPSLGERERETYSTEPVIPQNFGTKEPQD